MGIFARFSNLVFESLLNIGRLVEKKVIGALLIAVLTGAALYQLSLVLYAVDTPEKTAFYIEGLGKQAASTPAPEKTGLEPVAPLLAAADSAAGKTIFKRCAACHTADAGGANKTGPNLWGRVGGAQGGRDDFTYSDAVAGLGGTWTYKALNAFLADPKAYAPGTKMNFAGLRKVEDRANLIAFLRKQSDNPPPLP